MSTMPDRHRSDASRRESGRGAPQRVAEPTSSPKPVRTVDGAPPPAPHELQPDPDERRIFAVNDEEWIAYVAGKGASGSGAYGLGMVVAVHFARASAADQPVSEVLLARGRFRGLFDEELRALLAQATPIVTDAPPRTDPRRSRRSREW